MKEAQKICREVWEALNLVPQTGWQRVGAHDQCRSIQLQGNHGICIGTVYPSGIWTIYRSGNLLAEGEVQG